MSMNTDLTIYKKRNQYDVNVYMYLLKLSEKYIGEAIVEYDNTSDDRCYEKHYKIDYHMFAFSQLVYAIKDRLKKEYPKDKTKIENFFNDSSNFIKTVKKLANDLKHNGVNFGHTSSMTIEINEKENTSKVTCVRTDRNIESSDGLKHVDLSKLFSDAYKELYIFLDSNNYDF